MGDAGYRCSTPGQGSSAGARARLRERTKQERREGLWHAAYHNVPIVNVGRKVRQCVGPNLRPLAIARKALLKNLRNSHVPNACAGQ